MKSAVFFISLLLTLPFHRLRAAEPARPNIVFFLIDDLGARDLGCYGSTFYDTPNLDRLANQGTRLTRAYSACPVCSPTRASILTGKYPQRTGITDYIGAAQPEKWKRNTKHLPAAYNEQLALEEITLAEMLKAAGYATFFAGKWHLGGDGFMPENQGFDFNLGGLAKGGPYGGKKYFSPYDNPRLSNGPDGEHLPDRLATECAKFIEAHKDQPFLVYYPCYSVHTPLMARPDLERKYKARRATLLVTDLTVGELPRRVRMSQDHAVYAAMVEAMDQAVGKVLTKLDELHLAENTLVIFTSDNGGLSTSEGSPTSNHPLRAGKGWLYEGGIRTAGLVRWPGVIPAGVTNETPIISPDYLPTILEATGITPSPGQNLDGISILPILTARSPAFPKSRASDTVTTDPERPLFWHYPHYGNQGGAPGAAILRGDWKLIEWFEDDRTELFNLETDPGETRNLAATEPQRNAEMLDILHAWQWDVGAKSSTPNPAYESAKPDGRN